MHFSTFEPTVLKAIGLKAVNSSVLLGIFINFLPSTPKPNLGRWKMKFDVGSQISVDPMMIRCSRRLLLLYSPLSLRWQATVHRVRPERFRPEGRQQISSNKLFTSSFLELQSDRGAVLCIPKQPPWSRPSGNHKASKADKRHGLLPIDFNHGNNFSSAKSSVDSGPRHTCVVLHKNYHG